MQYKDALAVDDARRSTSCRTPSTRSVASAAATARSPAGSPNPVRTAAWSTSPAVTQALVATGYTGWVVFESDPSPHPATSTLLGGYLMQELCARVLPVT